MATDHMHLKHLARLTAAETGRPISACYAILQSGFDNLARLLASGESLSISNFGTFGTVERTARKGSSIHTKATIDIPAMKTAKFRPTGRLRTMVRNGDTNATISKGR